MYYDEQSEKWVTDIFIKNPTHYQNGGIETIELIKGLLTPEEFRGYLKGNIIKYLYRFKHKDGMKDLKKVAEYGKLLMEDTEVK